MRNNILREDLDEVVKHLNSDDPILTNGPKVRDFERKWSDWLGVKHSVFVNSGASANLLTMALLKIKYPSGGEIIVPSLTWISDISSVIQNGFEPVFVDIDPETLSMNTEQVLQKINTKTIAVFITHAQGFNGLTDHLLSELAKRNIPLIEDVCESHGATHNNTKLGTFGLISNFSFFYAHHMSTIEGGMICTDDDELYQIIRMLRSHGMVRESDNEEFKKRYIKDFPDLNPDFIFSYPAYNVRNNEIGGILGISQLKRLDKNIELRTRNLKLFLDNIDSEKYQRNFKLEGSSNYAFNLILKNPENELMDRVLSSLNRNGIEYRRGSAGGGNQLRQPYLRKYFSEGFYKNFPITEHVHFYGCYIGNFPDLKTDEINFLCEVINGV